MAGPVVPLRSIVRFSVFVGVRVFQPSYHSFHDFSPQVDSCSFSSPCLNPTDHANFTLSDRPMPLAYPSRIPPWLCDLAILTSHLLGILIASLHLTCGYINPMCHRRLGIGMSYAMVLSNCMPGLGLIVAQRTNTLIIVCMFRSSVRAEPSLYKDL